MIQVGQFVQYNSRGVKWASNRTNGRQHPLQWQGRVGEVRRISLVQDTARVMWAGRKTLSEDLPIRFLEVVGRARHIAGTSQNYTAQEIAAAIRERMGEKT